MNLASRAGSEEVGFSISGHCEELIRHCERACHLTRGAEGRGGGGGGSTETGTIDTELPTPVQSQRGKNDFKTSASVPERLER